MSRFEEKRESRKERYEKLAEKNAVIAKTNSISNIYSEKNSGIPMGQPILIGHHSEKRHRRQLERMEAKVNKGFEASDKADHYKDKADHIDNDKNIYADDPEAITKCKEKIALLEKNQNLMKSANKIIRRKKGTIEEKVTELTQLGFTNQAARVLFKPGHCCQNGYASFKLTNNNANLKRYKDKLAGLQRVQENQNIYDFKVGDIEVLNDDGQLQVHFPGKPNEDIRAKLKGYGIALKWSRYSTAWVRKITPNTGKFFIGRLKEILTAITETDYE